MLRLVVLVGVEVTPDAVDKTLRKLGFAVHRLVMEVERLRGVLRRAHLAIERSRGC